MNKEETVVEKTNEELQVFINKDTSDSLRGYANQDITLTDSQGKSLRITLIF
jgi:hypothetical protein